jgi:hypothetical protein
VAPPKKKVDVRRLVELYSSGKSIAASAKSCGLTFTMARSRLIEAGFPLRTAFERNRKSVDLRSEVDTNYVIGVYLGDGYAWKARSGDHIGFKVGLSTVDREFADAFGAALERMGVHTPPLRRKRYPNRPNAQEAWVLEVCSYNLYHWLTGLKPTEIRDRVSRSRPAGLAFLRGLYDSEGSFSTRGNGVDVRMANADMGTMRLALATLRALGFPAHLYSYGREPDRKTMHHVVLAGAMSARSFLEAVRPSIPRKAWAPGV